MVFFSYFNPVVLKIYWILLEFAGATIEIVLTQNELFIESTEMGKQLLFILVFVCLAFASIVVEETKL